MERLEVEVSVRDADGRTALRKLRAGGEVPGVVYGAGVQTTAVKANARILERLTQQHAHALVSLKGPKPLNGKFVLFKEIQRHPVNRRLLHCDFYVVDTKKRIDVPVPLRFVGKPQGVELGGVLEPLLREVEVSCLPLAIPEAIEVNVEALGIGDAIHVREIAMPEGVEPVTDPDIAVVLVGAPRVEEEAPAAEVAEVPAEGAPEAPEAAAGTPEGESRE